MITDYFNSRGIAFDFNFSQFRKQTSNFCLTSKSFFISPYKCFSSFLFADLITSYKRKLKTLIKSSKNILIYDLILILNKEIREFRKFHIFLSSYYNLFLQLDYYVYRLLWTHLKRVYSRRPKNWIYSKFWKSFSGVWKFSTFNLSKSKVEFLISHSVSLNKSFSVMYSPIFVSFFDKFNSRKNFSILFRKSLPNLIGINRLLFIKQKGLCKFCKGILHLKDFKLIYYSPNRSKSLNSIFLSHIFCQT